MSSPFSTYIGVFPKVFGCVCFVRIHGPTWGKVDPSAIKCIFVGYSPTQKGNNCYHLPSWKHFVSINVTFSEMQPYFSSTKTSL